MHRGLTVEVDLDKAAYNFTVLKKASNNLPLIAVVKADAYGHGAPELSAKLIEAGAETLAVAFISEARAIRETGINAPLLVMFDTTEPKALFDLNLTPVLHDTEAAAALSSLATKRNTKLDVHLKINTGMNRMGFESVDDMLKAAAMNGLNVTGLMSHFADADLADKAFTLRQIENFKQAKAALAGAGITPLCHLANSAASLSVPEAHFDALRPGLALYGISPFQDNDMNLLPAMTVSAKVLTIRNVKKGETISYGRTFKATKDMRAAVLAMGYADGLHRSASNKADVLIRGSRAPIVGRVCMDLTLVDVTHIDGAAKDDNAVIIGTDAAETITAWEHAAHTGTIPYESVLSFGRASKRTYL